jgi:uncharacterized protein with GYD domain
MPKYLFKGSYTVEGLKGLLKEGGTGRRAATVQLLQSLGGKMEAYYFAFGDNDFYLIADFPDNASASASVLAVAASGAGTVTTTVLLSPEEVDEAVKKHPSYRPPGQ